MKKFIKERNKILFVSSIISVIFIILSYMLVIRDMGYFRLFFPTVEKGSAVSNFVLLSCKNIGFLSQYSMLVNTLILLMSLFNVIGYVNKKPEFNLMAVGIGIYLSFMLLFYITPIANIMLLLNVLLILLGLIDSMMQKLDKKHNSAFYFFLNSV